MAKLRMTCPHCGKSFVFSTRYRGDKISCPACKQLVPVPRYSRKMLLIGLVLAVLLVIAFVAWLIWPMGVHWPDRRPIGALFPASNYHASAKNPRGWFSDPTLDVTGPGGQERFRKALMDYADASIAVLKRAGAQGAIVWNIEGEEYPHKISYIGDPRFVKALAPEMATNAAEFFKRFRDAGLRVGVTIRPQQLVFDHGVPRQAVVLDMKQLLLDKIDYARTNLGATLFYIDSTYGIFRPDEVLQLRLLAEERPDVLLIPEHHYLPYEAFSAPCVSLRKGGDGASAIARKLFPHSCDALDIADASPDQVAVAWHAGDIILFRAWYWNPDCDVALKFKNLQK